MLRLRRSGGGRPFTVPEAEVPGHPELGGRGSGEHYARLRYAAQTCGMRLIAERRRTNPVSADLMNHLRGETIRLKDWASHPLNSFPANAGREVPARI